MLFLAQGFTHAPVVDALLKEAGFRLCWRCASGGEVSADYQMAIAPSIRADICTNVAEYESARTTESVFERDERNLDTGASSALRRMLPSGKPLVGKFFVSCSTDESYISITAIRGRRLVCVAAFASSDRAKPAISRAEQQSYREDIEKIKALAERVVRIELEPVEPPKKG